jgi:hypothetical protein
MADTRVGPAGNDRLAWVDLAAYVDENRRIACMPVRSSVEYGSRDFSDSHPFRGLPIVRAIAIAHGATLTADTRRRVTLDGDPLSAYAVRNATVGGIRDARTAGIRPANAPMRMAEAMPPVHASTGITMSQFFELA